MAKVHLKTDAEIAKMRQAGRAVAITLAELEDALRPGLTTQALDQLAERTLKKLGAVSPFKGYPNLHSPNQPFPGSVCISINDELVHGVPSVEIVLEESNIVSIDCGAIIDGWVADSAWTYGVGKISPAARQLLDVTQRALYHCISAARAGNRTGDISAAIQTTVEQHNYQVARPFTCHGVGRNLHEPPYFYTYGKPGSGLRLKPGMTLALEPMVLAGQPDVAIDDEDGWTVFSEDGALTAHFEHTVAITDGEAQILTQL